MNNLQLFQARFPNDVDNYFPQWDHHVYGNNNQYSYQYATNITPNVFSGEIPGTHRYEFTITFNPKFYCDIADMEDQILLVDEKIRIKIFSFLNMQEIAYYNIVKEYQQNGAPHLHGTFLFNKRMTNTNLTNWEQFFTRIYGKSAIYYTGIKNKIHKNDHYNGSWQNYLLKDNPENYKEYILLKSNHNQF